MYGEEFVNGPDTLRSLLKCNSGNIDNNTYLSSNDESIEFEHKNFTNVIKSVDLKVDFIKKATNKLIQRKLVVSNKNYYAIFVDTVNHPVFTFIGWGATIGGLILTVMALI